MDAADISEALPANIDLAPVARRPHLFDVLVGGQERCYISVGTAGCSVHTDDARGRKPRNHTTVDAAVRAIVRAAN